MIQKNATYTDIQAALDGIAQLGVTHKAMPHADVLCHMFVSGIRVDETERLLAAVTAQLPGIQLAGAVEYNLSDEADKPRIKINVLWSKETQFHVLQIPCVPGGEQIALRTLIDALEGVEHVKALELLPVNPSMDVTDFLEGIGAWNAELPVFGTMAKPEDDAEGPHGVREGSFTIGQELLNSGFTVVVYAGSSLDVYMDYILGWKPIGREMSITLGRSEGMSACAVRLIDGNPAVDIYKKYLGITWDADFFHNVWVFPLMVRRRGVDLCFIPTNTRDGSLYFTGKIYEGEKLRFSYCTREEILAASFGGSERMKAFAPEAVFMALCGNRIGFLGEDAALEWNYYTTNTPELLYCHGYSEISYQGKKGGVLNSSLVAVGMREGIPSTLPTSVPIVRVQAYTPKGQVPLSYLVSHFFHEMTNELVHLQRHLEAEVEEKSQENTKLSIHVVQTLAQAIDAKDTYTNGHSSRVADYAVKIARRAGYSQQQQRDIYMMGLLHDVGKIGVPDEIINKPAKLTDAEYASIKQHPVVGARILHSIEEMPKLATGARWHHEKFDGTGYPDGLKGYDIPEEARIIAVADAYDAMTSNRSYRGALPQEHVMNEMVRGKGTHFDPRFAQIMLDMMAEDTEYSMREQITVVSGSTPKGTPGGRHHAGDTD